MTTAIATTTMMTTTEASTDIEKLRERVGAAIFNRIAHILCPDGKPEVRYPGSLTWIFRAFYWFHWFHCEESESVPDRIDRFRVILDQATEQLTKRYRTGSARIPLLQEWKDEFEFYLGSSAQYIRDLHAIVAKYAHMRKFDTELRWHIHMVPFVTIHVHEVNSTYLTLRVAQDTLNLEVLLRELRAGLSTSGLLPILKHHYEQDPTSKFADPGM